MPAIYIAQILLFTWLIIITLQSLKIFRFGVKTISKSWVFYISSFCTGVFLLNYFGFLDKNLAAYAFFAFFAFFAIYNLAFIFNLYRFTPLINRSEHFFGSILIAFLAYCFLSTRSFYTDIPSQNIKLIFLFCLTSTLGVFTEIVELFFDLVFKTKNIGPSFFDTNLDLLMNILGAGVFVVITKYFGLI